MFSLLIKKFSLGKIDRNCEIYVYATVILFPLIHLILSGDSNSLVFWAGLYSSVVIHTLGHIVVSGNHRKQLEQIDFFPILSVLRFQVPPYPKNKDLIMTAAGPGANLLLSLVLFGFSAETETILGRLASYQLVYGMLMLIPIFPFDGSRLLRVSLSYRYPFERMLEISNFIGQSFAATLILWSLYNGFYRLGFVSVLLYLLGRFSPVIQRFIRLRNFAEHDEDGSEEEFGTTDPDTIVLVETGRGIWEPVEGSNQTSHEARWFI